VAVKRSKSTNSSRECVGQPSSNAEERGGSSTFLLVEMATNGLRDQDMLDGASKYVIWKARISCLLDEHDLKMYVDSVVAVPGDADTRI